MSDWWHQFLSRKGPAMTTSATDLYYDPYHVNMNATGSTSTASSGSG